MHQAQRAQAGPEIRPPARPAPDQLSRVGT